MSDDMGRLLAVRNEIAGVLRGTIADAGKGMDSGSGMGSADLWVWIGGVEYALTIQPSGRVEPAREPASDV
jgi:hypothetical protein